MIPMPAFFANPLGLLGLLAVPAILLIHLLREKSRRIPVSTLFLLERLAPRTPRGRTIHRLQNSLPLWLQLLIALVSTWLLAEPRWIRTDSRQRATVIMDNSASMQAFRDRVLEDAHGAMKQIGSAAAHTEWTVLTSDRPEVPLYLGSEMQQALSVLEQWKAALPHHDPARAFSLALLDTHGGPVVFVTDRKPEALPAGVTLLACGEPLENCGFAGVRCWNGAEGPQWEALVKNSGTRREEREWWIDSEKTSSQKQKIVLPPGQILTVMGPFPKGERRIRVTLSPDRFSLDDVLPLVVPEPRPLSVGIAGTPRAVKFVERVLSTVPGARRESDVSKADVVATHGAPGDGRSSIIFGPPVEAAKFTPGSLAAEQHPLVEGLVWEGFLSAGTGSLKPAPGDQVLVWQRNEAIVFLRSPGEHQQLVLNFDFEKSNADRLPAFVLMVGRFLQGVQQAKALRAAENYETHQELPRPKGTKVTLVVENGESAAGGLVLRAPVIPAFFRVMVDDQVWLEGASHFGDPREADFKDASRVWPDDTRITAVREENTHGDRYATLWLCLLGTTLVSTWALQGRKGAG